MSLINIVLLPKKKLKVFLLFDIKKKLLWKLKFHLALSIHQIQQFPWSTFCYKNQANFIPLPWILHTQFYNSDYRSDKTVSRLARRRFSQKSNERFFSFALQSGNTWNLKFQFQVSSISGLSWQKKNQIRLFVENIWCANLLSVLSDL